MNAELLASQFEALEKPEHALIIDITQSPEQISTAIQVSFGLGMRI
jgi:gluconate kinase